MRKGGKTAPAWAKKLLQYAQKTIAACAKVGKRPPHRQKTLAVCAKNYCSMRKGQKTAPAWAKNSCSMRTKIGASSELLIVEFGGSEDNFL
jgi:hypothetical protein